MSRASRKHAKMHTSDAPSKDLSVLALCSNGASLFPVKITRRLHRRRRDELFKMPAIIHIAWSPLLLDDYWCLGTNASGMHNPHRPAQSIAVAYVVKFLGAPSSCVVSYPFPPRISPRDIQDQYPSGTLVKNSGEKPSTPFWKDFGALLDDHIDATGVEMALEEEQMEAVNSDITFASNLYSGCSLQTVPLPKEEDGDSSPAEPGGPPIETCDLTEYIIYGQELPVEYGGYSDIYLGILLPTSNKVNQIEIAIKALRAYSRQEIDLERAKKRLNREVYVLKRLTHPNIAEFLGIAFRQGIRPCIVIKWYRNGTAPKFIGSHTEVDRLEMVRDVANGLQYLHTLPSPVVHGDIKGSNVLVTDEGRAVLSDFGLSKVIEEYAGPTGFTTTSAGGSIRWSAPELLFPPEDEDDGNSTEVNQTPTLETDIWSFACVAYELLTGNHPYPDDRFDWNVIHAINSRRLPSSIKKDAQGRNLWLLKSTEVDAILRECWSYRPDGRPSMPIVYERLLSANMAPQN